MWQVDMRAAGLCVRYCLSALLDALIAPTANTDSDPMPNQPCYGRHNVIFIFIHSACPVSPADSGAPFCAVTTGGHSRACEADQVSGLV